MTTAALNLAQPYTSASEPPANKAWPYLKSHLAPLRKVIVFSLCLTVLTASIEVWLISYASRLIDSLAVTPANEIWQQYSLELIGATLVLLLIRPAAQFTRHLANDIGFGCNVANLFRWRAHEHLSKQSVGWFQEDLTGRTATRLVDIGHHAAEIVHQVLNTMAFVLVYMAGIVVLIAGTDARLALPLVIWLVLYITVMVMIIPIMVRAQQKFQNAKSALVGDVVDSFSNIDTLKLFADRDSMANSHKMGLEHLRTRLFKARQIGAALIAVITTLEGVMMVGFVGYGIWLWSQGVASIGLIGAAIALSLRITTMAEWVFDAVWSTFLTVGSLQEALKTIAQPITMPEADNAPELIVSGGAITISNASHHYGLGSGGLDGISLAVKPGEKVGFVGRSGSGKSTLVNLILRFFDLESGKITIDGQDISVVNQDSLRSAIGMVSQQAALLNRSVRDNISLGMDDLHRPTQAQIEAAAKEARAHEFIVQLKDGQDRTGYDAHVGERGVKLSGGQRQRIALARVILKNAPILILDEATSALDSEVEAEIQASLNSIMQDKTVIAIAHRLSTIAEMDRIVVIDNGKIVEEGTHQQLLETDSHYATFWQHQSGGFMGVETPEVQN